MGQTITEKIFSEHVGKVVYAGEIVRSPIDMVIGNDITTPISIKAFEDGGFEKLANPDGFAIVLDHFIPAKDIASANQAKISRDFAMKHNLKNFFDEKDMGIEHALLPEKGLVLPGDVIIGADSHTCTHGALGAFSTGMGSTDISFGMITGGNWFKVPESIKVVFKGKPAPFVTGKEFLIYLIERFPQLFFLPCQIGFLRFLYQHLVTPTLLQEVKDSATQEQMRERFGDIRIGTRIIALLLGFERILRRKKNDRNMTRAYIFLQGPAHGIAIHIWHHDI